ncbi:uncharacterized protein VTP21DRAFT_6925 [Calcarisporiella thermophila]|uniref:uncharacterized protein n=1 Tax=Calcarisporiella thermophila TaxID=911321 RepID=UPI003743DD1D
MTSLPPQHHVDNLPHLSLTDRRPDTKGILDITIAEQIRKHLPRRFRLSSKWSLLYSLDQHGISMATLYYRARGKGPCVLVIRDADDMIFGAFVNEGFKMKTSYYGTGECFLWKYEQESTKQAGVVKIYPWTGKNEYMILSEPNFIALGGGDGKFGLWINAGLDRGHSEPCPTFDNEVLSGSKDFECMELEVWAIGN